MVTAAAEVLVGAGGFFFCALGTTVKIAGLILFQPHAVLIGAILGGVACGLGI